jgi:hypothetical protein
MEISMAEVSEQLDTVVEAMVATQLAPDECIHGWMRTPTDDVVVFISNKDLKAAYDVAAMKMGQVVGSGLSHIPWWEVHNSLGHGRSLVFASEDGKWVSVGLGSWGGGPEKPLRYFEMMAKDNTNPHWQNGIEMCRGWIFLRGICSPAWPSGRSVSRIPFATTHASPTHGQIDDRIMQNVSEVTQVMIDAFLARLDAEPNPGPVWLDVRTQFANWARNCGFHV